tara:strand:+ start:232 stop:675 length:444 start_codon:yes stop_codon:yes gene_type:complete
MARKLTIKAGNSTIVLPKNLMSTFENVIEQIIPETKKDLIDIVEKIEQEAIKEWPVRQTRNGKKSPRSQNSKKKMYTEIIVSSNFEIIAKVGNSAPYAWAIKVGARSKVDLPLGRRVSNELLFKPMKKQTNRIIKTLKDETTRLMKK